MVPAILALVVGGATMGPMLVDAFAGALPVIIGALIAVTPGLLSPWIETRRQREATRVKREQQRDDFQRETLLELQTAVADLVRTWGKISFFDTQTIKERGEPTLLPDELSDEYFDVRRRVSFIVERVLDDGVREAVKRFAEATTAITVPPTQLEAEDQLSEMTIQLSEMAQQSNLVQAKIGRALRAVLWPEVDTF